MHFVLLFHIYMYMDNTTLWTTAWYNAGENNISWSANKLNLHKMKVPKRGLFINWGLSFWSSESSGKMSISSSFLFHNQTCNLTKLMVKCTAFSGTFSCQIVKFKSWVVELLSCTTYEICDTLNNCTCDWYLTTSIYY